MSLSVPSNQLLSNPQALSFPHKLLRIHSIPSHALVPLRLQSTSPDFSASVVLLYSPSARVFLCYVCSLDIPSLETVVIKLKKKKIFFFFKESHRVSPESYQMILLSWFGECWDYVHECYISSGSNQILM